MEVNVSNVCWLHAAVGLSLQGKKQEISRWCKQVKFIYEGNVRERWTSRKLVKIILIHLVQTDHNLCLKLFFDLSLTFAIRGTMVESPPE